MAVESGATDLDRERVRRSLFDTVAVHVLAEVLGLARELGAVVAPVKGVVLARWLYAHPYERPYTDLDLIVARADLPRMSRAVASRGWNIQQESAEMGELEFVVDRLVVEIHAEFGRRDLSRLTTDDVLARAESDRHTFPFEILRLDDIDHFFLLVANVVKKTFVYANPHHPADLEIFIGRLEPRWPELVDRARSAGFVTAVGNTASWMIEEHGSEQFARLAETLRAPSRKPLSVAIRLYRRHAGRQAKRLESASGLLGLALATLTPDDRSLRFKGLTRLLRRGAVRRLGRHPG